MRSITPRHASVGWAEGDYVDSAEMVAWRELHGLPALELLDPVQLETITEMVSGTGGDVYQARGDMPEDGCF